MVQCSWIKRYVFKETLHLSGWWKMCVFVKKQGESTYLLFVYAKSSQILLDWFFFKFYTIRQGTSSSLSLLSAVRKVVSYLMTSKPPGLIAENIPYYLKPSLSTKKNKENGTFPYEKLKHHWWGNEEWQPHF